MKFPLVVYSILYLLVLVVYAIGRFSRPRRVGFSVSREPGMEPAWVLTVKELLTDNLRIYVAFGAAALLSITFGKPGLGPQYAAWGIVVLQVLAYAAVLANQRMTKLVLTLAILALLAYLWVLQLPFFDVLPA
jgi:hypothetical protein